ncbi:MAG: phosphate acyltransferase [Synergistaceae bacterium]|nr:phosphate acyltransferase [Synergistaceae bacterium]
MSSYYGLDFLFERCVELEKKKVAVVCPYEDDALLAIDEARKAGYVSGVLVGERGKMKPMADRMGVDLNNFEILEAAGEAESSEAAVRAVSSGNADLLMKGLVKTATLLKAVLNREWGLRADGESLLSHVMYAEIPLLNNRVIAVTDGGMNMYPDLKAKAAIIANAVSCTRKLGVSCPKVAILSAAEEIYQDVPATGNAKTPVGEELSKAASDAALLCKMNERGIIKDCIVDGPMMLESAIFKDKALQAGINSVVGGEADILLVPEIESGNMLGKAITYMAGATCAGVLLGAKRPVIMLSRHDTPRTKLCSIALGAVVSC